MTCYYCAEYVGCDVLSETVLVLLCQLVCCSKRQGSCGHKRMRKGRRMIAQAARDRHVADWNNPGDNLLASHEDFDDSLVGDSVARHGILADSPDPQAAAIEIVF